MFAIFRKEDDDCKGFDLAQECLTMVMTNDTLKKRPQLFWNWMKSFVCMVEEHGARSYYEILTTVGEDHGRSFVVALAENSEEEKVWISKKMIHFMLQCSSEAGRYPIDERFSFRFKKRPFLNIQ